MTTANTIELAAISGAHGITGEVRLKLFTENVDSIKAHKSFNAGALTLQSVRPHKGEALARFAEVIDRNGAEALRGTILSVPREALPPLSEDEFYFSDLIGLTCVSTDGETLGVCLSVQNFGAGDILEIERPDKKTFMVPMNGDAVPKWDEQITIDAAFVI